MECLICEEKFISNANVCKIYGMGVSGNEHAHNGHLFCSKKCLEAYNRILDIHGKHSEILARKIVI